MDNNRLTDIGVILLRAQPFHKGHVYVINQILRENDKALILIGSANKEGTERNPFSYELRKEIVIASLEDEKFDRNRILVEGLPDWSMEDAYQYAKEWGNYLYYNIVSRIQRKTFRIYYNDDSSIVNNWFTPELAQRIMVCSINRTSKSSLVSDISSTRVRNALMTEDETYLEKALSKSVFGRRKELREILVHVSENPSKDFMMQ